MAKKERLKILQAGDVWYACQYTSLRGGVSREHRAAKNRISSMVREAMNFRTSYQKLWLILEATFDKEKDLYISLTYRDENLPVRKEEAEKRLTYFLRELREYRKARGEPLVYVRTTEGYHSQGRLHHHIFINATGNDYKIVRELWKKNGDEVEILPFYVKTAWEHAQYVTKEPKEWGRRHVGDRIWRASRNVKRPVPVYEDVTAGTVLQPPTGAFVESRSSEDNVYGRFQYLQARLDGKQLNTKIQSSK